MYIYILTIELLIAYQTFFHVITNLIVVDVVILTGMRHQNIVLFTWYVQCFLEFFSVHLRAHGRQRIFSLWLKTFKIKTLTHSRAGKTMFVFF